MFFIESLRKLHALQVFVYLSRIEVVAVFLKPNALLWLPEATFLKPTALASVLYAWLLSPNALLPVMVALLL